MLPRIRRLLARMLRREPVYLLTDAGWRVTTGWKERIHDEQ